MTRESAFERKTKETQVTGHLKLDGKGLATIDTGIGFFNHMLELFTFHSGCDLSLNCRGDLDVCPHHSVEDIGITLGSALLEALGDKKGIQRYASEYLPMDETLSRTVIDLSGRPYHVFTGDFSGESIGTLPTELIQHFFQSISVSAAMTLHQEILYGDNDHHKAESLFKGFGRSLKKAIEVVSESLPSTKGSL